MNKLHLASAKTIFGIDLRSLALFRVSLAVLILVDLIWRAGDLVAFYTDTGVLTRAESMANANAYRWSAYWMTGSEWGVGLLFLLAGFFAFLLLLGYRSRLMAFLSWALLVSLQNRNEFLTEGSDNLLAVLSFWAMFLPIGARFSIDAALNKKYQHDCNSTHENNHRYFSLISIAVLLQVMYLYFFTAVLKTGDPWRVTMDAAYYAVSLDQMATFIGHWMRDFPLLLTFGTYYVWYIEIVAFVFVFSPIFHVQLRLVMLALLVAMHAAFALSLHIGLFPLIDFVSLTIFLPGVVWGWLEKWTHRKSRKQIHIYYDEDCGFCRKTCLILRTFFLPSSVPITPAQSKPKIYKVMERENSWVVVDHQGNQHLHWYGVRYLLQQSILFKPLAYLFRVSFIMSMGNKLYRWVANNRKLMSKLTERWLPYRPVAIAPSWLITLTGFYFFYVVTYTNISSVREWGIKKPMHVSATAKSLRIDQRWGMFAPRPTRSSYRLVVPGTTRSGEQVDVYNLTMDPVNWTWPESDWEFKNYRWRKYTSRVRTKKNNRIRRGYGRYLCTRWNNRDIPYKDQLASFEIYYELKKTLPDGERGKTRRVRSWRHWCFPEYAAGKPKSFFDN